jgi:hypothetical protein
MPECVVCRHLGPGLVVAYWGHIFCAHCADGVASYLTEHDTWPSVPWNEADLRLLDPRSSHPSKTGGNAP